MLKRKQRRARAAAKRLATASWISVGARLTFRAEVMPGRESNQRTFTVERVLTNGRVELSGLFGQHAEAEFEPVR